MRAVASVNLLFAQVPIAVKVHLAAAPLTQDFHWVSPKGNRIQLRYFDSQTGEEVPRKELRRALEITRDKYVVLSEEEWQELGGTKRNLIEVRSVLPSKMYSPFAIERAYFLSPQNKNYRPYRLLNRLLQHTHKSLVGKWYTASGRDRFVVVQATGHALLMYQMFYSTELRELTLEFPKSTEPGAAETKLGMEVLDTLSKQSSTLGNMHDEWHQRLEKIVESKWMSQLEIAGLLRKSLRKAGFKTSAKKHN